MKKPPDFEEFENLLKGQVREPSPRFEEALRRIPASASKQNRLSASLFRIGSIAAVVLLTTMIGLNSLREDPVETQVTVTIQELAEDPEMLALFSLSEDLGLAATLLDEENQFALDYFSSAP